MSKEKEQKKGLDPKSLVLLPTGKPHISFSELSTWVGCSWRHRLKNIDGIDLDTRGPALFFGTAVHAACEHYTKTLEVDTTIATDMIKKDWKENDFKDLDMYLEQAQAIMADLPAFLETTFPGWKRISAEHRLYEDIRVKDYKHAFKGFIDAIIKAPGPRKKQLIWLIDWKTTGWGWDRNKKSDMMTKAQLILYKHYWCQEMGIEDHRDVRCAFVLLKRAAKPGRHCELITVSVGDKSIERALKLVSNMLSGLTKGLAIKNRFSCKWCEYRDTPHCT